MRRGRFKQAPQQQEWSSHPHLLLKQHLADDDADAAYVSRGLGCLRDLLRLLPRNGCVVDAVDGGGNG